MPDTTALARSPITTGPEFSPLTDATSVHNRAGRNRTSENRAAGTRRGTILVLSAALMVMVFGFLAFTVDIGYLTLVRTQLQNAADAAATAGAHGLTVSPAEARDAAFEVAMANPVAGLTVQIDKATDIELGQWDSTTRTFVKMSSEEEDKANAVRVTITMSKAEGTEIDLFFSPVIGTKEAEMEISAIATFKPRDVVLSLDFSASMNDDSEIRNMWSLGVAAIEANLLQIYQEMGSPTYGNMQWEPVEITSTDIPTVKTALGLDSVPYPYPGNGSWENYIDYIINHNKLQYSTLYNYNKKYGYLTLVNYWLEETPEYTEIPTLWQTSEQPITSLKSAVSLMLDFVEQVDSEDQVGFVAYCYTDDTAILEHSLTTDFDAVETLINQRQAGHYSFWTNLGDGIKVAKEELDLNGRQDSAKTIVLMTDGQATKPDYNPDQYALDQAAAAAAAGYEIVTISLGSKADTGLMQQIADIGDGVHYSIPGGIAVPAVAEQLKDAFMAIGANRSIELVR